MDDDERYKGCERLPVSCPSCSHSGIYEGMKCNAEGTNLSAGFKCEDIGGKADCQGMLAGTTSTGHNRYLANRVTSAVRHYVREYYACPYQCEEPSCRFETQDIVGGGAGISAAAPESQPCQLCHATMRKKITATDLYTQLSYLRSGPAWGG
jgi:hypothetical protein